MVILIIDSLTLLLFPLAIVSLFIFCSMAVMILSPGGVLKIYLDRVREVKVAVHIYTPGVFAEE